MQRRHWKLLGLAGLAGVAATGVVVARKRREHVEYDPDDLRGQAARPARRRPGERERRRAGRGRQRTRKLRRSAPDRLPASSVARSVIRCAAAAQAARQADERRARGDRLVAAATRFHARPARRSTTKRHGGAPRRVGSVARAGFLETNAFAVTLAAVMAGGRRSTVTRTTVPGAVVRPGAAGVTGDVGDAGVTGVTSTTPEAETLDAGLPSRSL